MKSDFYIEHRNNTNDINIREIAIGYNVNILLLIFISTTIFLITGKKLFHVLLEIIKWGRIVAPQLFASPVDEIIETILVKAIEKMPEIDKSSIELIKSNISKLNKDEVNELTKTLINLDHKDAVSIIKTFL